MVTYNYDKRGMPKLADGARFMSYEEALIKLRMTFVGETGAAVYEYIETLHKRLSSRPPWEDMSGFRSWDYGSPRPVGTTGYMIRVWQKDASTYPGEIDPNIEINIHFMGATVDVEAGPRGVPLFAKKVSLDITPSSLGLSIGAAWEKLITGSVDYGDY
jgi:hypothetical protein